MRLHLLLLCALAACRAAPDEPELRRVRTLDDVRGPLVLAVVAHPDDEVAFAGVMYKNTTHLGGASDLFVITNGEGGFKYATLAEDVYGRALTDEAVGRAELPDIRADELVEGCRYIGVRDVYLLRETDHRYTQDPAEVLGPGAGVWDLARVRRLLRARLAAEPYDFVLVLPPSPTTHGHHQAATALALEAVAELESGARPIVLCPTGRKADAPPDAPPPALAGFSSTRVRTDVGPFVFDRARPFGHQGRLDYRIVANWAIAAHKSQGTMQLLMNGTDVASYWIFALHDDLEAALAERWFERLAEPQFAAREYGPSAGTNAGR
jgi:LmbE family N-acetylglucosaminyl deacetylase